jgi:hypothetical protein
MGKESQVPGNDREVDVLNDDAKDELQVDIADDTPPEDRGRKPLEHDPLNNKDDDEAAKYTRGVQKRIKELTHKAHDERRRAEAAEREREEAIRFARSAHQRVQLLEQQLTTGEAAFATTTTEKEELALKTAKEQYSKAFEAGDPSAISDAAAAVATASQRLENAKHWAQQAQNKIKKAPLQQEKDDVDSTADVSTQKQSAAEKPHESALDWSSRNPWFGENKKMTAYVYGIHDELVNDQGLHPVDDADEYYAAIDAEMRKRFPDYDWDSTNDADDVDDKSKKTERPAKKSTSVVAPVTRTATGNGRKVTLTQSEVRIAKSLGLTPQEYAREKVKLQGA